MEIPGSEDPLEKEMATLEKGILTHSSILAWRIPWTEEPGGLQSMGLQRVGHDRRDLACMQALEKEMATHSSILAGESHGQKSLVGCYLWGLKELGTTEVT